MEEKERIRRMNKAKIEESHKRRKEQLAQEQLEKNLKLLEED